MRLSSRMNASLRKVAAIASLLLLVLSAGMAWYLSGEIYAGTLRPAPRSAAPIYRDAVVAAIRDSSVTLRADHSPRVGRSGVYGLRWSSGEGLLGPVLGRSDGLVRRRYTIRSGSLVPGTKIQIDPWTYSGTPRSSLNLPYEERSLSTELGSFPAWFVSGAESTWVLFVHGKGATREETLRAIEFVAPMGFPCLAITYRNDPEAVPSEDRRYGYGMTEWRDLEAAARFALEHRAKRMVLVGYSLGGGIVLRFMACSTLASRVSGLILESPCVRLGMALDYGLSLYRLPLVGAPIPPPLRSVAKRLAEFRYGVRWSSFDRLQDAHTVRVPILLLHGEDDDVVPIGTSEEFARSSPGTIQLARFPGAGHVESWNVDPDRYRSLVRAFLTSVATAPPS